jgi:micrococcal nuclease
MHICWLLVGVLLTVLTACSGDSEQQQAGLSQADLERAREEGRVEGLQTAQAAPVSTTPLVTATAASRTAAQVTRVVDGDTIEVSMGGFPATVRYLGMNSPDGAEDCYGTEASTKNASMVAGKNVELEKDVSDADSSGRLLRYVYVDGFMVNEVLVRDGFGEVSLSPPDLRHAERLLAAQIGAIRANRGLWAACA